MTDFLADAGFAQDDVSLPAPAPADRSRAKVVLHDKFYTPQDVAARCVVGLMDEIGMRPDDLFVEPSAGAGAFCAHLPAERLIALDIAPEASGIETQDFLTFQFPDHAGRMIVIGNPPFGHNGTLARAFLRKAMDHADTVAYILPASYAKPSMQRGINRSFHLIHEELLPRQHFETPAGDRVVNTVFQIWVRRAQPRDIAVETIRETDFAFVKDINQADLVIRRVGARAGVVLAVPDRAADGTLPMGFSKSSNHYIKAINCDPATLTTRLVALGLPALAAENGIMPSLPKPALIAAYDKAWRAQEPLCPIGEASTDEGGRCVCAPERPGTQRGIHLPDVGAPDRPDPRPGAASFEAVGDAANAISHSSRPGDRPDQGRLRGDFPEGRDDDDGTGEVDSARAASAPLRSPDIAQEPAGLFTPQQSQCPLPARRNRVLQIRAPARISPRTSGLRRSDRQASVGHTPLPYVRAEDEACAGRTARGPPVPGCRTGGWGVKPARAFSPVRRPRPVLVFQRHNAGICRQRGDAVEGHELIAIVDARPRLSPFPCKGVASPRQGRTASMSGLHVHRAAAVDRTVDDLRPERIAFPPGSRRLDIDVTIEDRDRSR